MTTPATTMTPADTAPPDWASLERDVACPLCDYSLRGLAEPRCPECGHRFTWAHILSPQAQLHPYLFEHHPRRNAWSFWRTQVGGLRPRRFWRTLNPSQPSRPGRLVLYWLIAALLMLPLPLAPLLSEFRARSRDVSMYRAQLRHRLDVMPDDDPEKVRLLRIHGSVDNAVLAWSPPRPRLNAAMVAQLLGRGRAARTMLLPAVAYAAWPWMTFAALMLFRASMRQARVKPIHVLRCAIYACDVGLLVLLGFWLLAPDRLGYRWLSLAYSDITVFAGCAAIAIALFTWYRLGTAYRFYMGFDRPYATALAAQAIVLLSMLVLLVMADDLGFL